jgi:hypothetical protein
MICVKAPTASADTATAVQAVALEFTLVPMPMGQLKGKSTLELRVQPTVACVFVPQVAQAELPG